MTTSTLIRDDLEFPTFPPGLWRRIVLLPGQGWIGGALEDDMHSFRLRIDHAEGRITRIAAKAVRHPWSACPGATDFLARDLVGAELAEVAARDPAQHCTHLFDLTVLAAAHVNDTALTRFDMFVADRVEGRTTVALTENDEEKLRWQLDGLAIVGDSPQSGLNLRQLSKWKHDLPARDAERATLMRRAIMVSGARTHVPASFDQTAAENPSRMGVCFNYQLPQAEGSKRSPGWHTDFSMSGRIPLEGLDPAAEFAVLGEAG